MGSFVYIQGIVGVQLAATPKTKVDWKPLANRWLKNKHVVFHTDSARSYKAKVDGVLHDNVVHKKKRVKVAGRWKTQKPVYVKMQWHCLPGGRWVKRKAGTQIIDRAWQFLKKVIGKRNVGDGSKKMSARVRSAQWFYWNRLETDLWAATATVMRELTNHNT